MPVAWRIGLSLTRDAPKGKAAQGVVVLSEHRVPLGPKPVIWTTTAVSPVRAEVPLIRGLGVEASWWQGLQLLLVELISVPEVPRSGDDRGNSIVIEVIIVSP